MDEDAQSLDPLRTELASLRARLAEAEETLGAIRRGDVDAVVVPGPEGDRVYTLGGAGRPHRLLVESMSQGAATLTPDGTLFYANRRLAEMLHTPLEQLIGTALDAHVAPWSVKLVRAMLDEARRRTVEGELWLRAADGTLVPAYLSVSPFPADAGPGLTLVATDLSAQKRQAELVASENLARSILEQAADAIIVCDETGRIVRASDGAARLCRVNPLLQRFDALFGVPPPRERVRGVETRFRCPDDSSVTALMSAGPLYGPEGQRRGTVVTLTDITDRTRAEEALRESEARYRRLVEASPDAIFVCDGAVLAYANAATADMLGARTADDLVGRRAAEMVPPEGFAELERIAREAGSRERTWRVEQAWRRLDRSTIDVEATAHGLPWQGRPALEIVAREITDRRRAAEERERLLAIAERARLEAERASRAKDEFLAILGHELRNPLSAVRNAVVAARLDDTRRQRALEIAWQQAEQLTRLVEDLLDIARITRGQIVLRRERVSLGRAVERAVETMRALVEMRGLRLEISLPEEALVVEADPTRLEQIIGNLLGNAVKYSQPGGRVWIVVQRQDEQAVLRVRDAGIGIAPEVLPRIFDRFAQCEPSPERVQGGLGIGLTIVRTLVELHGGRVEARSEGLGRGAEILVWLPALPAGERETVRRPAAPPQAVGRVRVLVVEDSRVTAESLVMLLEVLGHEVHVVCDGLGALQALRTTSFGLVLLDIGLPAIDGYEVARRVRAVEALRGVLLVALTGYGRDEDRERALAAGFDDYLVKPVDVETLQGVLARAAACGAGEGRPPPPPGGPAGG